MHQGIGLVRSGQQYKFGSDRLDASFADEVGAICRDAILRGRVDRVRSVPSYSWGTWFPAFLLRVILGGLVKKRANILPPRSMFYR